MDRSLRDVSQQSLDFYIKTLNFDRVCSTCLRLEGSLRDCINPLDCYFSPRGSPYDYFFELGVLGLGEFFFGLVVDISESKLLCSSGIVGFRISFLLVKWAGHDGYRRLSGFCLFCEVLAIELLSLLLFGDTPEPFRARVSCYSEKSRLGCRGCSWRARLFFLEKKWLVRFDHPSHGTYLAVVRGLAPSTTLWAMLTVVNSIRRVSHVRQVDE